MMIIKNQRRWFLVYSIIIFHTETRENRSTNLVTNPIEWHLILNVLIKKEEWSHLQDSHVKIYKMSKLTS